MSIQVRDLFEDPVRYLETLLWIRDKQERVIPFTLNAIQRVILRKKAEALARGRKPRFIYLKYRRGGVTTLEQCLTFKLDKDEAKYKAAPGCLDDTVIAWSIFLQLRKDLNAATVNVSSASPVIVRGRIYGIQE
jgi:hypothetical protein